jgi:circadian clock protein KaiB
MKSKESRAKQNGSHNSREARQATQLFELRLYVAGQTAKSLTALANLKRICDQHMPNRYRVEVIDLMKNPQLAQGDQILAIPTLVRRVPEPLRKIIGDLSNTERVLVGLDIREAGAPAKAQAKAQGT